MAATVSTN
jgi:hypothetical protein